MRLLIFLLFTYSFAYCDPVVGTRKIAFIITENGIYPESISAFKGERLQLFVTSTKKESCLMMKGYKLFISSRTKDVGEGMVDLNKSGEFKIYCPSDDFVGKITVLNKKSSRRDIASTKSESIPSVWVPKDYSE